MLFPNRVCERECSRISYLTPFLKLDFIFAKHIKNNFYLVANLLICNELELKPGFSFKNGSRASTHNVPKQSL
jgi:hypothetical protein